MMHSQTLPMGETSPMASPLHDKAYDQAAALNRHLLQLASEDKWPQIADVVQRRNAVLARVPVATREQALLAAQHCNDQLKILALSAKTRYAEQLGTLRQGRRAAESYRANR